MFLGGASIQTSLIPNFLCFPALIIHKVTLRTDFKQSYDFAPSTLHSFVGVVAIVVIDYHSDNYALL